MTRRFSAEETHIYGHSMMGLLAAKRLHDLGYYVYGYWFVDESFLDGDLDPDLLGFTLATIFEYRNEDVDWVKEPYDDEDGCQRMWLEERDYPFGYEANVPLIVSLRNYQLSPLNNDGKVTRYVEWFEKRMQSFFQSFLFVEVKFHLTADGFHLEYDSSSDVASLVIPLHQLKVKLKRYLTFLERSESQCTTKTSA